MFNALKNLLGNGTKPEPSLPKAAKIVIVNQKKEPGPNRTRELKIKIASLAAESRLIKNEENRLARRFAKARSRYVQAQRKIKKSEAGIYWAFEITNPEAITDIKDDHRKEHVWRLAALHEHRTGNKGSISWETRMSYLAYGFIRGKRYSEIEIDPCWKRGPNYCKPEPEWQKIADIVWRFSNPPTDDLRNQEARIKARQAILQNILVWKGN
jgi:hypothetical protein